MATAANLAPSSEPRDTGRTSSARSVRPAHSPAISCPVTISRISGSTKKFRAYSAQPSAVTASSCTYWAIGWLLTDASVIWPACCKATTAPTATRADTASPDSPEARVRSLRSSAPTIAGKRFTRHPRPAR